MKLTMRISRHLVSMTVFCQVISLRAMSYQQIAQDAQEHNHCNSFLLLPTEILEHIFSYTSSDNKPSLDACIEQSVMLKTICKRCDQVITPRATKIIGQSYVWYESQKKDDLLGRITRSLNAINYKKNVPKIELLLYSGANANSGMHTEYNVNKFEIACPNFSLLHKVLLQKDMRLLKLLFKCGANPNQIDPNKCPLFFLAPSVVVAELFFKCGADVNLKNKNENTVLWRIHDLSVELVRFYIERGVDVRYVDPITKKSVLHILADRSFKYIHNSNDFVEKGVLLVKIIPDMINTFDAKGWTPIAIMQSKLEREYYHNNPCYARSFKKLISIFKAYASRNSEHQESVPKNNYIKEECS